MKILNIIKTNLLIGNCPNKANNLVQSRSFSSSFTPFSINIPVNHGVRPLISLNNRSRFIRLFSSSAYYTANIINMKNIDAISGFAVYKDENGNTVTEPFKTNIVLLSEPEFNSMDIFNETIYNQLISEIPYIIGISLSNHGSEFYDIYQNVYHYIDKDADRSEDMKILFDKIIDSVSDFLLDPNKITSIYDLEIENNFEKVCLQFMTLEDERRDSHKNEGKMLLPPFGDDDDDDDNEDDE
jgi:hypothetical protein